MTWGFWAVGTTRCQLRSCPHCNLQNMRFQSHRNLDPGALHPDMFLTRHESQKTKPLKFDAVLRGTQATEIK
jgi:hypothetical protein